MGGRLGLVTAGLVVALALVLVVAPWASEAPDGLERVAIDHGFGATAADHPLEASPVADYALRGVTREPLAVALAGAVGVGLTFLLAMGILTLLRRRPPGREGETAGR